MHRDMIGSQRRNEMQGHCRARSSCSYGLVPGFMCGGCLLVFLPVSLFRSPSVSLSLSLCLTLSLTTTSSSSSSSSTSCLAALGVAEVEHRVSVEVLKVHRRALPQKELHYSLVSLRWFGHNAQLGQYANKQTTRYGSSSGWFVLCRQEIEKRQKLINVLTYGI